MSPSSPTSRSSDSLWGVLVGTYLGLVATPLALLAVVRLGVESTTRRDGTAVRLGATRLRWLPAALPVPYALGGFASLSATGVVGLVAFFFGLGATVLGLVLGVMARTRHTDAVLDGVDIACAFDAGWPAAARRRLGVVAGAVVVVGGACFVGGLFTDGGLLQLAGQLLFPVGLVLYTSTEKRSYTVSPAGLEQRMPVARRLSRWDAFESYSRTADALVLHRPRRMDARFALSDLDDPDAVEAAIARHLPAA